LFASSSARNSTASGGHTRAAYARAGSGELAAHEQLQRIDARSA
jgi:hypothetical protein